MGAVATRHTLGLGFTVALIDTATRGIGQHQDNKRTTITSWSRIQPDALNRVHRCRMVVVKLVYHNGIAFAPHYGQELAKIEQVLGEGGW
jgi:hypothetical protein